MCHLSSSERPGTSAHGGDYDSFCNRRGGVEAALVRHEQRLPVAARARSTIVSVRVRLGPSCCRLVDGCFLHGRRRTEQSRRWNGCSALVDFWSCVRRAGPRSMGAEVRGWNAGQQAGRVIIDCAIVYRHFALRPPGPRAPPGAGARSAHGPRRFALTSREALPREACVPCAQPSGGARVAPARALQIVHGLDGPVAAYTPGLTRATLTPTPPSAFRHI